MANLSRLLSDMLRQHLTESDRPRIPAGGDLLWRWFCDLSAARSYHAYGPNPISYAEIEAYFYLMRWSVQPHHVAILRAMDSVFLEHDLKLRAAPPAGVKTIPQRSSRPLTPQLFDALFG